MAANRTLYVRDTATWEVAKRIAMICGESISIVVERAVQRYVAEAIADTVIAEILKRDKGEG